MGFKKWSARTRKEKEMKRNTKMLIQDRFRKELGLNVDMVKQGFGTTNDGNSARRFFSATTKSAEITGLDINLVEILRHTTGYCFWPQHRCSCISKLYGTNCPAIC